MKVFKKVISKDSLHIEFVKILNGLLQLSDRESQVLALLLSLDEDRGNNDLLSTENRRYIMDEMNLKKSNLSKYISDLKSKGVIMQDENGHYINSLFVPDVTGNISETVFILDLQQGGNRDD